MPLKFCDIIREGFYTGHHMYNSRSKVSTLFSEFYTSKGVLYFCSETFSGMTLMFKTLRSQERFVKTRGSVLQKQS